MHFLWDCKHLFIQTVRLTHFTKMPKHGTDKKPLNWVNQRDPDRSFRILNLSPGLNVAFHMHRIKY